MKISRERLQAEAQATDFRAGILEKVVQLLGLLEGFESHPFLKERLALKGGTALNLFQFDLPRLSVDIDVNYIGAAEREAMLEERPKVEQAVQDVCSREGMSVTRRPDSGEHAGGKWRLRYDSAMGEGGNLEVDLNFMYRVPLWPVVRRDSRQVGSFSAKRIPVVDLHEIAAGKMAALLSRQAGRDLFDVHQLLTQGELDRGKLRLGFVLFGAMNRKDWRTVSQGDAGVEAQDLQDHLLPLMRSDDLEGLGDLGAWTRRLVDECREHLGVVLPFADNEREFLNRLLDHGEIAAPLLTQDGDMAERINRHPLLQWKALNVREHKRKAP
jgi:hypothetical protein